MGAGKVTRAQRYDQVTRLRAKGLYHREIAAELGISRSHVVNLLGDPDGSKDRARKRSYAGKCLDCSAATDGSNGRSGVPVRCASCEATRLHAERYWTAERIIGGLHRLADDLRMRRPVATDTQKAIPKGDNGYGIYPPYPAIQREFGSWGNAMEAAGFDRPRSGIRTPEGQERVNQANRLRHKRAMA